MRKKGWCCFMKINPVYKQETKVSARSFRFPLVIFLFNCILALVALLDMYSMITQVKRTAEIQYSSFLSLYIFVATVEFTLLLFLVPAISAGTISGERERQTLDLMLTTSMSPTDIVLGKLLASLSTVLLLIVSSFPIIALVFIYGGVMVKDIALLLLCYGMTALLTGSIGIFCSSSFKKTTIATVVSYCLTAALVIGTVAVNHLASLLLRVTAVQGGRGSGNFFYLLLLNPASTFRTVLNSQIGSQAMLENFFPWLLYKPESLIIEHWFIAGLGVQFALSVLFLRLAVEKVKPCKRMR